MSLREKLGLDSYRQTLLSREVHAIEGGGLGTLVFLRRWALEHNIRFLLFNPSKSVRDGLKRARSISKFYIATMDEMMALLAYANSRYALAV